MDLFTLSAKLVLDTSEYEKGIKGAQSAAQKAVSATERVITAVGKMSDAVSESAPKAEQANEKTLKSYKQLQNDVMTLANAYKKQGMNMSEAMKKARSELVATNEYQIKAGARVSDSFGKVESAAKKAGRASEEAGEKPRRSWSLFKNMLDGTKGSLEGIMTKSVVLGNAISGAIGRAAGSIKNLATKGIMASSKISAETAQFESSFGALSGRAKQTFESIGKDTNILASRLRTVGTKAFSQMKGAGVEASQALAATDKYTRLAADAAAQYDMSLEDVDQRMRSFLRGNTEAGDSIQLFASEMQRNDRALAKYNKKWHDLNEAQRQMLMLDIVEEIYTLNGTLGQAGREGKSLENVLPNLNKAFEETLALITGPTQETVITPLLNGIKDFLNDEDTHTKLEQFGLSLASWAGEKFDNIETLIKDVAAFVTEHGETIQALLGAVGAFLAITHPWIILVAALAAIVLNWKDIKEWAEQGLAAMGEFFSGKWEQVSSWFGDHVLGPVQSAWKSIKEWCGYAAGEIGKFFSSKWEQVSGWFADHVLGPILSTANAIYTAFSNAADALAKLTGQNVSYQNLPTLEEAVSDKSRVQSNLKTAFGVLFGQKKPPSGSDVTEHQIYSARATGLDYVPYDDYRARLHEGEAVLTRLEAENWRKGAGAGANVSTEGIASAVAAAVREALGGVGVYMGAERVGDLVTERVSRNIAQGARRYQFV